jgi:hypothetical protein
MSTTEAIDLYQAFSEGALSPRIMRRLDEIAAMNLDVGHNNQIEPLLPVHRHDAASLFQNGTVKPGHWERAGDWQPWVTHWYAYAWTAEDRAAAAQYDARLVLCLHSSNWDKLPVDLAKTEPEVYGDGRAYLMAQTSPKRGAHCLNGRLIEERLLYALSVLVGNKYWPGLLIRTPNLYAINLDGEQTPVALPGVISRAIGGREPDQSPEWFRLARFAKDITHRALRECFYRLGWRIKVWTEPTWCVQPSDPIICGWRTANDTELSAEAYISAARADMAGRSLMEQPLIFATHSVKRGVSGDWSFLPPERLIADMNDARRLGAIGPLFWWAGGLLPNGEPLPGYAAALDTLRTYLDSWRNQKMDETLKTFIDAALRQIGLQNWPAVKALVQKTLPPQVIDAIVAEKIEAAKPQV